MYAETGAEFDPVQKAFLDEQCIVLDENDIEIGHASKIKCHKGEGILHRAFSVFYFNENGELLLQQRSRAKITFPLVWANTVCSHPLYVDGERGGANGVFAAAHRKCIQELGLHVDVKDMKHVETIKYFARFDNDWCESEIDYLVFVNGKKDVEMEVNPNEVNAVRWVTREGLKKMLIEHDKNHSQKVTYSESDSERTTISPWFLLIAKRVLPGLWDEWDRTRGDVKASGDIILLQEE